METAIENIANEIINRQNEKVNVNNGDYINDEGLWVCGKCNTPKQVKVDILGTIRTPMCLCECQTEIINAEKADRKRREEIERIGRMRKEGFPDEEMCKWTFDKDDGKNGKILSVARKYVEHFDVMRANGKGLLFFGGTGTGKTYIAACIANALIDRGVPCLVTNLARLINTISGMYEGKQEYIDGLNRFSLLVIDDLAAERNTEYMNETVFNIIDARCRAGKPLIVTTNLTGEELKNPSDIRKQRIYSRLYEMCIPIRFDGDDRRKSKLRADVKKYNKLLGLKL